MIYRYPHPELFTEQAAFDLHRYSGKLILWGAGKIGGIAAHCLKSRGIDFVAFCDTSKDMIGAQYCGHPVLSPKQARDDYPQAALLITSSFYRDIEKEASALSWNNESILDCVPLFLMIDFQMYDFWMNEEFAIRTVEEYLNTRLFYSSKNIYIDQLCLPITTRCTLRCKHCSAYIPYIEDPEDSLITDIVSDLNDILEVVGFIRCVYILGGEPLLHPEISELLHALIQNPAFDKVAIVTNGTLLPGDELLKILAGDPRIMFRISNYGTLSRRIEELIELLEKNCIKYEIVNYAYWNHLPVLGESDMSPGELKTKFENCTASTQLQLVKRRIFCCTTLSHLWDLSVLPHFPDDCVDICAAKAAGVLDQKIKEYIGGMREGRFLKVCRFCSGNHTTHFKNKVLVAEQTTDILHFENF